MTLRPDAANNTDCDLVARLWNLLDDPKSGQWYLGSIIRNGLDVPELGIKIPAFPTIAVGDIPQQTMFEWALEHLGIAMSGTTISGVDTFTGGTLHCTPVSGTETDVDLTLQFASIVFSGAYDVGASGATGCALATAATILGNPPSRLAAGGEEDRLALAAWYRDAPEGLNRSDNGQVLIGAYNLHEDTIQKATTSTIPAAQAYRTLLAQQKVSADAVTASTRYYAEKESGKPPPGPPPTIGAFGQYAGGYQTYAQLNLLVDQLRKQNGLPLEPGNEYADLQNAMTQFHAQVKQFQRDYPGERDTQTIMEHIANAQAVGRDEMRELGVEGIPVHDAETGEVVDHVEPWPVDRERALRAYKTRVRPAAADDWFHVKGTFADAAQQLQAGLTCAFTSTGDGKLYAKVTATRLSMANLSIVLGNKAGFDSQPGLYDKVATWIANTQSFQDTLKSRVSSALNSTEVLAHLSDALNAGLKKLGLQ